jgi:hypothetical protein
MKCNPMRLAFGLALAIGTFSSALAQFSGSISGTVTDPAGAVIPGVTVTLTNVGTGEGKTGTTDSSGFYQFVSLAPGNYALKTSAKGFADSQQSFSLETNQTLNLPVKVTVGTSSETVQVHADALVPPARRSQYDLSRHFGAGCHWIGCDQQRKPWIGPR